MRSRDKIESKFNEFSEGYDNLESKVIKQYNEDDAEELRKLDHYIKILHWVLGEETLL